VRRLGLGVGQRPGPSLEVPGFVQSVVVTPDQSRALVTYAGAEDWVTVAFDVETGKEVASGMPGQIRAAISSTGRLVAADAAGDVTEFDPRDLTPMASLPGARAGPSSLQFDDSGNHLLVTAADQTVQVYDMDTRSRLGDPIPSAAREGMVEGWLRPDGAVIAVNGPTGIVEWTIEPTAAAEAACVFAGRNLTPAEWVTYLGAGETYHRTCPDYPDG
jgi:DNA-binding beta-propeller fold protein YncE